MRPVALETADLVLRELAPDDLAALHAYDSDPDVCRFQPWGPNDLDATRAHLASCLADAGASPRLHYELALIRQADGAFVGNAGLRIRPGGEAELGFTLRRDAWGRGYATQAARALVGFAFGRLEARRVRALCDAENAASLRVLEKVGLRRIAALPEYRRERWRTTVLLVAGRGGLPGDRSPLRPAGAPIGRALVGPVLVVANQAPVGPALVVANQALVGPVLAVATQAPVCRPPVDPALAGEAFADRAPAAPAPAVSKPR